MRYTFVAVIVEAAEGGYIGYVEALPGAVARGASVEVVQAALGQEADVTLAGNRLLTSEPSRAVPPCPANNYQIDPLPNFPAHFGIAPASLSGLLLAVSFTKSQRNRFPILLRLDGKQLLFFATAIASLGVGYGAISVRDYL